VGYSYVFLGLSITSSWGNGHATTYRGLLRRLAERGHQVLFLERDLPFYAESRDMPDPPFARTELYRSFEELVDRFRGDVERADVVVVGSFVPEGVRVGRWVLGTARGKRVFYDIDTPVTLAKLARGDHEYLSPDLVPRWDLYLSFTGGPTLDRLASRHGARRVRPLYCSVDPRDHFPEPAAIRWDMGYLGTYGEDRQAALDRLLVEPARRERGMRFAVFGAQYPGDLAFPANVSRRDHVPPEGHRAFYCAQRFTLNITRGDMLAAGYSPSVRLFEAAACGVPIVTDAWPGLDRFFTPGSDILVARTSDEVIRILRSADEAERLAIAARARARVLADHTAERRAEELERYTEEVLDGGGARSAHEINRS
jgi:spore maturation protein CgeB